MKEDNEKDENVANASAASAAAANLFLGLSAGRLKSTPRTGWLQSGVPPAHVESVASHSYRMAMLAMAYAPQVNADFEKNGLTATGCTPGRK